MKTIVRGEDLAEVARVVGRHSNGGIKISDVVDELAKSLRLPQSSARFVVRDALDKGKVCTDRNFRLHLRENSP
jgi:hypothetical protein